ncbi:hypothetical protein M407DRAFT_3616 [Tulasnella calospora MUT 4182]|uniref:Uncharacterized protein n=1 Tax=Tulasnella calospora MUT 4182 TaxID=1051891 RepID=A0A0C3LJB1_9AGAM|nr:hypothetical protein M407DRAFT_3616 [Tulasnella calospora MUT 4182]
MCRAPIYPFLLKNPQANARPLVHSECIEIVTSRAPYFFVQHGPLITEVLRTQFDLTNKLAAGIVSRFKATDAECNSAQAIRACKVLFIALWVPLPNMGFNLKWQYHFRIRAPTPEKAQSDANRHAAMRLGEEMPYPAYLESRWFSKKFTMEVFVQLGVVSTEFPSFALIFHPRGEGKPRFLELQRGLVIASAI